MLIGSVLLVGIGKSILLPLVALLVLEIKLRFEEQLMLSAFPDDYARYRQRVARLLPVLEFRRVTRSSL